MQFLSIDLNTKLTDLAEIVGQENLEEVLHLNGLSRTPYIGAEFYRQCENIKEHSPEIGTHERYNALNLMSSDEEVFEYACLMDDYDWMVYSAKGTFPGMLRIPDHIQLPSSSRILGGTKPVSDVVYSTAINQVKNGQLVDPAIFGTPSSTSASTSVTISGNSSGIWEYFKIPWGKIQIYSSLSDESMDIPCYPETISDGRKANYDQMPNLLYQYEPWYVYTSSGPRTITYKFHFHRDMWNGDHRNGGATKLIRFCEANCYPHYNGASVFTSTVALLIDGNIAISGIMTDVSTDYSGPIGHDGLQLECNLSLTITEVARKPLDYETVKSLPAIG
jgi:hypothetical protein